MFALPSSCYHGCHHEGEWGWLRCYQWWGEGEVQKEVKRKFIAQECELLFCFLCKREQKLSAEVVADKIIVA